MKIKEIAFVCCAVSDMSRARAFYEGILGLKPNAPVAPDPYCIEYDVGAGTFAIESNSDWPVSPDGMSVTFEVATISKLLSDTYATTTLPSSSGRLRRRFATGRRFAIPTGIGW
jgi:catechol 2,3-dioxygenase-like lactoylglutathione lyase family enzyme